MAGRKVACPAMRVRCAVVVGWLVLAAVAATAGGGASAQAEVSTDAVEMRDRLIADQESLLNAYRCMFHVDTHAVPGGCTDGRPAQGLTKLGGFHGTPAQSDIDVRDRLIASQEALLNTYRCMFDIDTQLVPEGCPAIGQATQPAPRSAYVAVAAGMRHSCAIATDGTIKCWGSHDWGKTNPPQGTYTEISAGWWHSCAIATDSTIECWGRNDSGQTDPPEGTYTAIAAGFAHSCAIPADGTIECWGGNRWGQTDAPQGTYTAISAGTSYSSCAITTDSTIECWGDSDSGQADAPEGTYTAIAVGHYHSCAIATDGTLKCWGGNRWGQTGQPAEGPD